MPHENAATEAVTRNAYAELRARRAIEVDRAGFLPGTVWEPWGPGLYRRHRGDDPRGRGDYARVVAAGGVLVTEWDNMPVQDQLVPGRLPTVTVPPPSLLASMMRELSVPGIRRALHVGTGSGYPAAVLGRFLGPGAVTSTEHRVDLALEAADRLHQLNIHVPVVTAHGLADVVDDGDGPWDAVVSSLGITGSVPAPLIRSARAGAVIVAPYASAYAPRVQVLVRLEVGEHRDRARGSFVEPVPQDAVPVAPGHGPLPRYPRGKWDEAEGIPTSVRLPRDFLPLSGFSSAQFALGLLVRHCQRTIVREDGRRRVIWRDLNPAATHASLVTLSLDDRAGRPATVSAYGPRRLWDELTHAFHRWSDWGRPSPERFGLIASAHGEVQPTLDDRPLDICPAAP